MATDFENGLPRGWVSCVLGDILSFEYGKALRADKRASDGVVPVFGSNGIVGHHSSPFVDNPCLIVGRKGAAGEVHISKLPCWPIDTTYYVIPPKGIDLSFAYYMMSQLRLSGLDRSTAIPGLNRNDAYALTIAFPPLPEQHRIVAKLEELLTRIDAGVKALNAIEAQLKRYRQSVLKSAFEGNLTAEWREAHKGKLEPAAVLLERIKEERKKKLGKKYKEPNPIDTSALPELPEGWVWATVIQIAESMKNGIYKPKHFYHEQGTACLRMYNIENGFLVWKDIKRMKLEADEIQEYQLLAGDILVNRVNSRELVGKAAVFPAGLETCVYESKNIRLRLHQAHIESKYVNFWFLNFSQAYFSRNAQQTVGMASINQEQLGSMPIPLASTVEQRQVVSEIERCFSVADSIEKAVDQSLAQSERLRQSILKRAFEGNLVPQDPNDEPAERLLQRIKRDRQSDGNIARN